MSTGDLSRLVEAIAADRDSAAFSQLFEHVAPRVKAYLVRTGTSAATAEDIAQETMLTVWRKASYFDSSRAGASTWIFTIARNLRVDWQRRNRPMDPSALDRSGVVETVATPEDLVVSSASERGVRAALNRLSKEQETIVRLSFFSGAPHSEIVRELGMPLGTVKSRVRLALTRLKRLLDDAS